MQAYLNDPLVWVAAGLVIVALIYRRSQSSGSGSGAGSLLPQSRPSAGDALWVAEQEIARLALHERARLMATSKARVDLEMQSLAVSAAHQAATAAAVAAGVAAPKP